MKFTTTYCRTFQAEGEFADAAAAKAHADTIVAQFGGVSCYLLSIIAADYVDQPCAACALEKHAVPSLGTMIPSPGGVES
jgi:hypothetical protein